MNIETFSVGPYPLDIKKSSIMSGNEARPEELLSEYEYIIDHQVKMGFIYISDPQLTWVNLTYPFSNIENIKVIGYQPIYNGKLYLHKLYISGKFDFNIEILKPYLYPDIFPKGVKKKFSIVGPYTFYKLLHVHGNKEEFIKELYIKIIDEALELGYQGIDLIEALAEYYSEKDTWLIRRLYKVFQNRDIETLLYLNNVDIYKIAGYLTDRVDYIALDYLFTDLTYFMYFPIDRIILQLIETRITSLEDYNMITKIIREFSKKVKYKTMYVTNTLMLNILPIDIAIRKTRILALIKRWFSG